MADEPQAGNRQRDRRARIGRRKFGEEAAIERPFAWAEVAGDEHARPHTSGQARVLQKAAMRDAGRLGRRRDRPAHAGRAEFVLARLVTGPAGRALEAGRQRLRVGKKRDLLGADRHGPDGERVGAIPPHAGLQRRLVVGDGRDPDRRRRRRRPRPEGAISGERRRRENGERRERGGKAKTGKQDD